MSQAPSSPPPSPQGEKGESLQITPRYYQAMCGLALAAMFLVQLQQSTLTMPVTVLANLFVVFIGTLGLLYRIRISPIFVLIAFGLPQLIEQHHANQTYDPERRDIRFLDVSDVVLCVGMLTYLIGQYRLHGLWFGVLPGDGRNTPVRSEASLDAGELVALIFPIPACALLAEFGVYFLKQPWLIVGLPPRWNQFLVVAWLVLLAMFLSAHFFRYWARTQMDRVSAQLLLQDVLWQQTRSEQRRINRWMVWKKLQESK